MYKSRSYLKTRKRNKNIEKVGKCVDISYNTDYILEEGYVHKVRYERMLEKQENKTVKPLNGAIQASLKHSKVSINTKNRYVSISNLVGRIEKDQGNFGIEEIRGLGNDGEN